ncbi:MAG: hypothetical protein ACTS3T_21410 [Almyronema sp.]
MNVGDVVRLKQPFYPNAATSQRYCYGLVAEIIFEGVLSCKAEVLVYLYDPDTAETYADETGQPLYCFYSDEVLSIEN